MPPTTMCLKSTSKRRGIAEDANVAMAIRVDGGEDRSSPGTDTGNHNGTVRNVSSTESSTKMLGAVLTSLVALYVGMNRFHLSFYLMVDESGGLGGGGGDNGSGSASKPIACCGILVLLALRKVWNDRIHSMVENCSQKVDNVMTRVSSNKTLTRIKSSSMRLLDLATGRQETGDGYFRGSNVAEHRRTPKLSIHAAPFVSLKLIAELSLNDIKDLFRYVYEMNRNDFDRHTFLSNISSLPCWETIHIMDQAVRSSRGESSMQQMTVSTSIITEIPLLKESTDCSPLLDARDMDALYFVAVICIFAEWRTFRLVPPAGYHRYSIGMGLAKRDLIQNALKIECAVHQYFHEIDARVASGDGNIEHLKSAGPSIRQLIEWEINRNVHSHLPKLVEKSSASGFIWIFRQVQYQNRIFQNILQIPDAYPTSKVAVTAAYRSTYDAYHGFFIKNIFLTSFDAAPSHVDILLHMIPPSTQCRRRFPNEQIVTLKSAQPTVTVMTQQRQQNPWILVSNHIVREWMKLERFMSQCNGQHNEYNDNRNGLIVPPKDCSTLDLTSYAREATTGRPVTLHTNESNSAVAAHAINDIHAFCESFEPILRQLESLINHLNINDPSKC